MRGLISIAVREIVDRRALVAAAAVAAAVPFVTPLVPGIGNATAGDVRGAMAWGMGLGLAWIMSLYLGERLVAPDLKAGRMGFLLTLPVRLEAVWFGKLLATWALIVFCEVIILAPSAMVADSEDHFSVIVNEPLWAICGLLLGVPLFLIALGHAVSVMFRARSAWLFFDFAAFLLVAGTCVYNLAPFFLTEPSVLQVVVAIISGLALLALVGAGGVQVVAGRGDIKRGHALLSVTLWSAMAVVTACVIVYTSWFFSVDPGDFSSASIVADAPSGDWVAVDGTIPGRFDYMPTFLYNVENGASVPVAAATMWGSSEVQFSGDGSVAAWTVMESPGSWQIRYAALGNATPVVEESSLIFSSWFGFRLSGDGSSILIFDDGTLTINDLADGRMRAVGRLPQDVFLKRFMFRDDDTAIILARDRFRDAATPRHLRIFELDDGGLRQVGLVPEIGAPVVTMFDHGLTRALVAHKNDRLWSTVEVELPTGAVIREFPASPHILVGQYLEDGSLVYVDHRGEAAQLVHEPVDGSEPVRADLPEASRIVLAGPIGDGRFAIGLSEDGVDGAADQQRSVVVDVGTGEIEELEERIWPAFTYGFLFSGRAVGPRDHHLFTDEEQRLLELDPRSGKLKRLLGVSL